MKRMAYKDETGYHLHMDLDDSPVKRLFELESAFEKLGTWGKFLIPYRGDPRGPIGKSAVSKSVRDLIAEGYRVEDVDGNMWIVILEPDFTEADTLLESGKEATQRENALALVEMRLKNDTSFQMIRKGNSHKVVDLILNGLAQTLNEIRVPGGNRPTAG